jgi:hypothetical protein
MELSRNQFFMFGLIVLAIGLHLRYVDSFVLNERTTKFFSKTLTSDAENAESQIQSLLASSGPSQLRTVNPPRWLGWSLLSVGAVMVLYSLVMQRPSASPAPI